MGVFIISLQQKSVLQCEINLNKHQLLQEGMKITNKLFRTNYVNRLQNGETDIFIFEVVDEMFEAFAFPPDSLKLKMIV